MRRARWPRRRALMSLPGYQQRALDRIGRSLALEDPGLGLRFAFFTVLTRQEAMPENEHVPGRWERFRRRAVLFPLLAVGIAGLVAASGLTPSPPSCSPGMHAAAAGAAPVTGAARCRADPAIKPETMPVH
jgi:Protein of unknown function (DUF3040)